jgi:bacteriocin biosynthesis cyclodehydratase domain-containing protein
MSVDYARLAATRPRIKQDVLYTQTRDGVLFHNTQGGFQLSAASAYRVACVLVPRLTGEHTVEQLCRGLPDGPRAMVAHLVSALLERGFARDVPVAAPGAPRVPSPVAERFGVQINYIDHYADHADERFLRFRGARVAVLGDDLTARWCVLSLLRNGAGAVGVQDALRKPGNSFAEVDDEAAELAAAGCPVEFAELPPGLVAWDDLRGYDVVVTTAGARQVTGLLAAGVPEGVSLLPASVFGGHAMVGPLSSADRSGCWVCAALRFGANRPPGAAADVWSELVVAVRSNAAPSRPLAAMLGNLLAYEVFRHTTGALAAETDGHVIVQDLDSMDCVTEPVPGHPQCPYCQDAETPAAQCGELPQSPATATPADAEQADAMLAELGRRSVLVRPMTGVFTSFDDESLTQLPLKIGRVRLGLGHAVRRGIAAFDVHHVVGARLSALYRAAEAYVEHVVPLRTTGHDGSAHIAPTALAIGSGTGAGADADGVAQWVEATSLLSGTRVLVPAAAVRSFGPANRDGLCMATAAGTGAAGSPAEALGRALSTAIAHDALRRALAHERAVTRIPLSALEGDPELRFLVAAAGHLDLDVELLELTAPDEAARVLAARAVDGATGRPVWSVAVDPVWQRAARDALCELAGRVQLSHQEPDTAVDAGDPLIRSLDPYALTVKADADPGSADLTAASSWSAVLDDLRRAGRDALVVPAESADLRGAGISAVRLLLAGRD